MGTRNHFARDAGIPLDAEQAVAAISAGHRREVDLGEVNGRVFVNNSAVGLYPDMVRFRDETQARTGRSKRLAMLSARLRALRSFRRRRLWISAAGLEAPLRTPLLFVGNNRYQVNLMALGRREALDGGELCLYAIRARNRLHLIGAGLRGLFGKLDQQRDFLTLYVPELEIAANLPALTVALDGETLTLATPLRYRIRPRALTPHRRRNAEPCPGWTATKRSSAMPRARRKAASRCQGWSIGSKVSWKVPQWTPSARTGSSASNTATASSGLMWWVRMKSRGS